MVFDSETLVSIAKTVGGGWEAPAPVVQLGAGYYMFSVIHHITRRFVVSWWVGNLFKRGELLTTYIFANVTGILAQEPSYA